MNRLSQILSFSAEVPHIKTLNTHYSYIYNEATTYLKHIYIFINPHKPPSQPEIRFDPKRIHQTL